MSEEMKEQTRGEQLRRALLYDRKNGYDRLAPGEPEAMEAYCTGYKQFLDAGKTKFIQEWWDSGDTVTLITRPRRFGKTLNMSMLKCFFETGSDRTIFDGLEIVGDTELCDRYSGRFFVSSLSLKGAERQQEEN